MTRVSHDFIAVDLRPIEHGVVPALNGHGFAAVYRGFSPVGAVAFVLAFCRVDVGKYADTGTFTCTNTHADTAAAAAVLAAGLLSVGGAAENDVVFRVQQRVAARFQLAFVFENATLHESIIFPKTTSQILTLFFKPILFFIQQGVIDTEKQPKDRNSKNDKIENSDYERARHESGEITFMSEV